MTKNQILPAILLIIFAVTGIASSFSTRLTPGPTAIVKSDSGTLITSLTNEFLLFNNSGEIERKVEFSFLNIEGPIEDMQIIGPDHLLVGDAGTESLHLCDLQFINCKKINTSNFNRTVKIGRFFKFFFDTASGVIYIADTEQHRLLKLNLSEKIVLEVIPKAGELKFPNDIVKIDENHILLADTMNERVIEIELSRNVAGKITKKISMKSKFIVDNESWPVGIYRMPTDEWWVIARSGSMQGTSVLRFDSDWKPLGRVKHPDMIHPVDIIIDEYPLISDKMSSQVYRFNKTGEFVSKFEQTSTTATYTAYLDELWTEFKLLKIVMKISIFMIILMAGILLWQERKRKKQAVNQEEAGAGEENAYEVDIIVPISSHYMIKALFWLIIIALPFTIFLSGFDLVIIITTVSLFILTALKTLSILQHTVKRIQINKNIAVLTNYKNISIKWNLNNIMWNDNKIAMGKEYYLLGKNGALIGGKKNKEKLLKSLLPENKMTMKEALIFEITSNKYFYFIVIIIFLVDCAVIYFDETDDDVRKDNRIMREIRFK